MNCYYCNDRDNSYYQTDSTYWCLSCRDEHDLHAVITAFDSYKEIKHVSLYVNLPSGFFSVTLKIQDNYTSIVGAGGTVNLIVPGLFINLFNVKNKLKLYLLFS